MKGKLSLQGYIVVELIPIADGSELGARIPGQWMEKETIYVQQSYVQHKARDQQEHCLKRSYAKAQIHCGGCSRPKERQPMARAIEKAVEKSRDRAWRNHKHGPSRWEFPSREREN